MPQDLSGLSASSCTPSMMATCMYNDDVLPAFSSATVLLAAIWMLRFVLFCSKVKTFMGSFMFYLDRFAQLLCGAIESQQPMTRDRLDSSGIWLVVFNLE